MSEYYKDEHRYDDILDLPRPRSGQYPPMALQDRAAQFAPFAALTGYGAAIQETARLTEEELVLDEGEVEKINEKLCYIAENLEDIPRVTITYFMPDKRKKGGSYLTLVGCVKKVDTVECRVLMDSGVKIPMGNIVGIEIL